MNTDLDSTTVATANAAGDAAGAAGTDAAAAHPADAARTAAPPPLRVGFMRGIAPQKWARRYQEANDGTPLELHPLPQLFAAPDTALPEIDVLLERCPPGAKPAGSEPDPLGNRERFAMQLYTEQLAVVVEREHPFAEYGELPADMLGEIKLLDHPDHQSEWPAAEPWLDPSWRPAGVIAALEIVATGAGGILLPLAAARHLAAKKQHAVLPLTGDTAPAASTVWASWAVARDAADTQLLAGILRGRTPRSSRGNAGAADPSKTTASKNGSGKKPSGKGGAASTAAKSAGGKGRGRASAARKATSGRGRKHAGSRAKHLPR